MNKCWQGCRETRTPEHSWQKCKTTQQPEHSMMVPQRNRITMWSSNYTSRYIPKWTECGVLRYCVSVFRAAKFTRAKRWKCPQTDECISKGWCVHTTECYSTFKRKEMLQYATAWMNLEHMMLSETIQTQQDMSQNLTHMRSLKAVRLREQVHGSPGAGRRRGRSHCFVGVAFILRDAKGHAGEGGDLHNEGVFNTTELCTSLVAQWLGRGAFIAGVWSLVRKLRSYKPRGVARK